MWIPRFQFTNLLPQSSGGTPGEVGIPTDGSWDDGLLTLSPHMSVADAIDSLNEILLFLAPQKPQKLSQVLLQLTSVSYRGRVPLGLGSSWSLSVAPGQVQDRLVTSSFCSITVPPFGPGDRGLLRVYIRDSLVATLDLSANFIESMRLSYQDISQWNNSGRGDPVNQGVVTFSSGTLRVLSCGPYNNFPVWQVVSVELVYNGLLDGGNVIKFVHIDQESVSTNEIVIFYDSDSTVPSFVSPPFFEVGNVVEFWLSGIRYLGLESSIILFSHITNLYRQTYHPQSPVYIEIPGSPEIFEGPSGVPDVLDDFYLDGVEYILSRENVSSVFGVIYVSALDPYGYRKRRSALGPFLLVHTFDQKSNDTEEFFVDEVYRLPLDSYDYIPDQITYVWDSMSPLLVGDAQCWGSFLSVPMVDFTQQFVPEQYPDRDYSLYPFAGDAVYLRAFIDRGFPHNSVSLDYTGTTYPVSPAGTGKLNIFVKLPSLTGWLDAGSFFSPYDFEGRDGDGCLVEQVGTRLQLTFGQFSTAYSGYMIIVKIVLRSYDIALDTLKVIW